MGAVRDGRTWQCSSTESAGRNPSCYDVTLGSDTYRDLPASSSVVAVCVRSHGAVSAAALPARARSRACIWAIAAACRVMISEPGRQVRTMSFGSRSSMNE
jgi:hypothetical protein